MAKGVHLVSKTPPKLIRRAAARDAGKGVSPHVVDRAFWLGEGSLSHLDIWVTALEAIDKRGDKEPLLTLLRSDHDLPRDIRFYVADLLTRYQLRKKPGRQSTPAYERTDVEARLFLAMRTMKDYRARGMSVKDALAKAAEKHSLDENQLAERHAGRRGSTNRMKKRQPPRP